MSDNKLFENESQEKETVNDELSKIIDEFYSTENRESTTEVSQNDTSEIEENGVLEPLVPQDNSVLDQEPEEEKTLEQLLVETLEQKKLKIATAESCTGGLLSQMITSIPGCGDVFELGVVSYANKVKIKTLGVKPILIKKFGAVSSSVAVSMARLVKKKSKSDIGVGITGLAGPSGGSENKPVGTVFISVFLNNEYIVRQYNFPEDGTREEIRSLSALHAIELVLLLLLKYDTVKDEINKYSKRRFRKKYKLDNALMATIKFFIPWKGDNFIAVIFKLISIIALAALIWSGSTLFFQTKATIESNETTIIGIKDLNSPPTQEEIKNLPPGYNRHFAKAFKKNEDTIGSIKIKGGTLESLVMQTKDNVYYLEHNYAKQKNQFGVPFVDFRNIITPTHMDHNTIIYSHNVKSGKMFGDLEKYRSLAFYKKAPIIEFDTVFQKNQWKIVTMYMTNDKPAEGPVFEYYNYTNFENENIFNWYMNEVNKRAFFKTDVDVKYGDKFITLSTCGYDFNDARLVLIARMVRPGENPSVNTAKAYVNANQYKPDGWYKKHKKKVPAGNTENALAPFPQ